MSTRRRSTIRRNRLFGAPLIAFGFKSALTSPSLTSFAVVKHLGEGAAVRGEVIRLPPECMEIRHPGESPLLSGEISNRLYQQLQSYETLQPRLPSFPRRRRRFSTAKLVNPCCSDAKSKMDSRLRVNDGQESWGLREKLSRLPKKKMKPKHLQHFPRVNKIFPGQKRVKAGMTIRPDHPHRAYRIATFLL